MSEQKSGKRAAWIAGVVLSFASMFALTLKFLPYKLTSDSAFFPLLARWQARTGQLFPDGMCYSTQVMGISPNLYMLPYLLFIKNNDLLVRTLGVFTIWAVIIVLIFLLFKGRSVIPACVVCILLLIPYLNSAATEEYFFEAGYINQIKWMAAGLLLYTGLWNLLAPGKREAAADPSGKKRSRRKFIALSLALFAVIVYSNSCTLRNLLVSFIPMTGAVLIDSVLRAQSGDPSRDLSARQLSAAAKRVLPVILISALGAVCAFFLYRAISAHVWKFTQLAKYEVVASERITGRILTFFNALFSICGNRGEVPLYSVRGVAKLVHYFFGAFLFFGVPIYSLLRFKKLKEDKTKIIILALHISSFLAAVLFIAGNLDRISNDQTRYCLPVFMNCIFMLGALLYDKGLRSGSEAENAAENESEKRDPVLLRLFIRALPVLVLCYAAFSHFAFWKVSSSEAKLLPSPYGLTEILEEKGLTHGYATFWNAHKNTVLSNHEIEVCGVTVKNDRVKPYLWLTNEEYYSDDYYSGPSFLILEPDETERFDAYGGAAKEYGAPEDELHYQGLTIYVYDHNLF